MKLDDRMKKYERVPQTFLAHRTPVICRFDGRAFHTFTNGLKSPFDEAVTNGMKMAAAALVQDFSCAKLAYTQSDEISVLLIDYTEFDTMMVFDGEVSKLCSVGASVATAAFNKAIYESWLKAADDKERAETLSKKLFRATFDGRAYNVPREEVPNYFLWRLRDAQRNAIQSVGQSVFSHKELHGVPTAEVVEMLLSRGVQFDSMYPSSFKNGSMAYRKRDESGKGSIVVESVNSSGISAEVLNGFLNPPPKAAPESGLGRVTPVIRLSRDVPDTVK